MEQSLILSILICTLPRRNDKLRRLLDILLPQVDERIGIVQNDLQTLTIGAKRNALINESSGEYVCFMDDDDLITKDYVSKVMEALKSKPDCVGIQGVMLTNGICPRRFFHTIEVDKWYTNGCEYYRTPNHLNPIKRSIAKQVMFNEFSSFGEDKEYSSGIRSLVKTEVMIDDPIYYYLYYTKPGEAIFA
jgi:glycosyltransferase involved in cell wall biosynthesis